MSLAIKKDKKYCYQDYLLWSDEERWELIDGSAYNMTPAPFLKHQKIAGNFYTILNVRLKGKTYTPFIAPTDVVLSAYDVVQPDILVVCKQHKITEKNIQGAPALVIEVLSPSTSLRDRREKKALYEKYGVKEYIILDPLENYAERFFLEEDATFSKGDLFGSHEQLPLRSLTGITIPLTDVFAGEEQA